MAPPKELSLGLAGAAGLEPMTSIRGVNRVLGPTPQPWRALLDVPCRLQRRRYVQPQMCTGSIRGKTWSWSDFTHILFYNVIFLF